jgi:hypothetical protein
MKVVKLLEILLAVYFFAMSAFFIFSFLFMLSVYFNKQETELILNVIELAVYAALFSYTSGMFIKKNSKRHIYGITTLISVLTVTTLRRLVFITNFQLESTDLNNFLLFGLPLCIVFILYKLQKRSEIPIYG